MKSRVLYVLIGAFAIMVTALAGCASSTPSARNGSVVVRVTDAPANQNVTSVMVTVSGVQIHLAGNSTPAATDTANATTNATPTASDSDSGWINLNLSGPSTFDLLKIKGLEQELAVGNLTVGHYTQIRMAVSKVQVAILGGQLMDATIPSGNLKFVQPFDVVAGNTTVILFDFDAANSLSFTGNDTIIFSPVIKLSVN